MRERLRVLEQRVAAAPFELLGDLQVRCDARCIEQAVIDRVAKEDMLEELVARRLVSMDEIGGLHCGERRPLAIASVDHGEHKMGIEATPDHRCSL